MDQIGGYEKLGHECHPEYDRSDPLSGSSLDVELPSIWDREMQKRSMKLRDPEYVRKVVGKLGANWKEGP